MIRNQIDRWWSKVEQRHERSSIGSLITPEDIYLRPEILQAKLASHPGLDIDQLGVVDILDEDQTLGEIEFTSRPTLRFHGSIPALSLIHISTSSSSSCPSICLLRPFPMASYKSFRISTRRLWSWSIPATPTLSLSFQTINGICRAPLRLPSRNPGPKRV